MSSSAHSPISSTRGPPLIPVKAIRPHHRLSVPRGAGGRRATRDAEMKCGRCCSPHRPFPDDKPSIVTFFFFSFLAALLRPSAALLHLRGDSFSFTFLDAPARFAVPVDGSGICGSLHLADPIDACSPLRSNVTGPAAGDSGAHHPHTKFLLIARGVCSFEKKVRVAQDGGFKAAIIYDDQTKSSLYSMIGESWGIHIHAVFVSKMAGETLKKFSQGEEGECCIGSSIDETAGTVLVISFVSLIVIISVIATFLFARNCRLLRNANHSRPASMNRQAVEVLPSFTFKTYLNTKCMAETCAICLEDYKDEETLRVLPCLHEFHSVCVDSWLTKWGTFCPVCKHEMCSGSKPRT